ncbi:MAG TPA: carboxypeptidase-like regulatory domain-containing protein, partial [Acidobacteriota bacterium]|nr:carboxypeptidase-like regulatory domain-containing protein [Acidobacteriota bacterium]
MRSRVTLGLLIVTSLVSASSLLAQAQYSFYGIVRQPDGSLAPGATVNISGPSGMTRQAFADDMGRYEISGLARGQYHIIAANPADPNQIMESVEVDTS